MKSGRRKTVEGIELPNQESIRTLGEKEKPQVLGNTGTRLHHTSGDEGKNKKRVFQKNEQSLCMILTTIL